MFRRRQASLIELALQDRRNTVIRCSLNPQEEGVAVQSIRTAVQERNVTGDHFLVTPRQVTLREVDGVGKIHYLS